MNVKHVFDFCYSRILRSIGLYGGLNSEINGWKRKVEICRKHILLAVAIWLASTAASFGFRTTFPVIWSGFDAANTPFQVTGTCSIYTPPAIDCQRIRAIIIPFNLSQSTDTVWREAARTLGVAIIDPSDNHLTEANINEYNWRQALDALLSSAADASGHPEIVNVPIIPTGFSGGGYFSGEYVYYTPEKVLAMVGHHSPAFDASLYPTESRRVHFLGLAGNLDYSVSASLVEICFSIFRNPDHLDARTAFAMNWQTGHQPYQNQGMPMMWTWIAESLSLRLPSSLPSLEPGNPVAMNTIPVMSGWLGEAVTDTSGTWNYKSFPLIAPAASYTGSAALASWLPNETVARVYRALSAFDGVTTRTAVPFQGPLAIVGDAAPSNVIESGQAYPPQMAIWPVGSMINITVDPRGFGASGNTQLEYYDGSTLIGRQTVTGSTGWTVPYTIATQGVHSITVNATDSVGHQTSAFRSVLAILPHQPDGGFYRFEKSPGFKADHYDFGNLVPKSSGTSSGATQVALSSTGAGSAFPREFRDLGVNDYAGVFNVANGECMVRTGDNSAIPSGSDPFTLEAFINLATSGSGAIFRTIAAHGYSSYLAWQLVVTGEGSGNGARRIVFQYYSPSASGTTQGTLETINSGFQVQTGQDYYVAMAFNPVNTGSSGLIFYLKNLTTGGGLQTACRTHTLTSVYSSPSTLRIGAASGYTWDGLIDEVRLEKKIIAPEDLLINQASLSTPSNFTVSSGTLPGQIQLTWNAVTSATMYHIERSTTNNSQDFVAIADVSGSSYMDSSLDPNITYYYRITAKSALASSNVSGSASSTPFLPNTFAGWQYLHFRTNDNVAPADALSDPDNDGMNNLLEYAMGTDPNSGPSVVTPALKNMGTGLPLQFVFQRIADPLLIYKVQASSDLSGNWSDIWSSTGAQNTSGQVTVTDIVPVLSNGKRFLRLQISQ